MADISTPENAKQWRRMAKTANNNDVLWDRVPREPIKDIVLLSPHCDDEALFCSYSLMRLRPLVVICTESWIQYERGDISCDAETRRKETIAAMKLIGCPVVFLGIKDTELTEDILRERLKGFNPETIYVPAIQGGNPHHDIVGKVGLELFGKACERYTTYSNTELYTTGGWEIRPTHTEMELKNRMLDCYVSQINLPSTAPHFTAVRNKSEWLL
jgi:LmbE family N-acetylglucosaminyl deacetylase